MNTLIQKSIRFPAKAVELIEEEMRNTLGIDFNEFLKVFVIKKAEEIQHKKELAPELMYKIEKAKRDAKQGKRSILKTNKDIDLYLNKLVA